MLIENKMINFELFRYQLLPLTRNVQADMFQDEKFRFTTVEELKDKKNAIFAHVLSNFPSLQYRQADINHKVDLNSSPWFVVEINTQKSLTREKQDFNQERIDTWPHVIAVFNNQPDVQLLAVSKNTRAFTSSDVVAKILQENLGRSLQKYQLTIQVEAIFEEEEFWKLVNEYAGRITAVNFQLISPNMANISNTLEIDLHRLNADTNSHCTDIKLNSSDGSVLEIKKDNPLVNSIVNYAAQGGGDIAIRVRGIKKTVRTSKGVKETSIDEITMKNPTPEILSSLLERIT